MINNLMYIELKMGYSDDDPAWIGYVKTSKNGTVRFPGFFCYISDTKLKGTFIVFYDELW